MARTYDMDDLLPHDPEAADWALAWVRRFAADVPNGSGAYPLGSLDDAEWTAWLQAHQLVVRDPTTGNTLATYYRPQIAAAAALEANPYWLQRESIAGYSAEWRDVGDAAGAIRRSGAFVDSLIQQAEAEANRRITIGQQWDIVF